MNNHDSAMTIKEVAKFLNISTQMVYNLVNNGSLKAFKIGSASRIMYSDVQEFIERQKVEFTKSRRYGGQPDEAAFTVNHVNLQKGGFWVRDVTFSLPKGKIMSLLGPSGSGKTLLLRAIAGLDPLASGSIFLGKRKIDELSPQERKVGLVFENYALFPQMDARQNIEFPLRVKGEKQDTLHTETSKRVTELRIDTAYLNLLPHQLPEGMKQLVVIAREKNHDTELFLMDEPMSQLDAQHHVQMRMFIQKVVRDFGKTTIMTFHDPEDALVLSDYIGIMEEGQLIQFGETWEVYHHPINITVMEMLSRLGLNTLRVEVEDGKVSPYGIPVDAKDGFYDMAFRAEEVELSPNGILAKIRSSQFYDGKQKLAVCDIGDGLEVALVLPRDAKDEIVFLPLRPQFFRSP